MSLAEQFEENREHLRAVACRILGSETEADDALQEASIKILRSDADGIENVRGWLTTVVARVCLDALRSRQARREEPLEPEADASTEEDLDAGLALADAIGPALQIVLQAMSPVERVVFVLHDVFAFTFEEIAPIVDRTPAAARQLASRARRRIRGAAAPVDEPARHQRLVDAFLAASRDGDMDRLLAVLAPDVVLRVDARAVSAAAANRRRGAPELAPETRGAERVAETFKGRARGAMPALIDGAPGAVWSMGSRVVTAFIFTAGPAGISGIEIVMDPARVGAFDVKIGGADPKP